MKKLRVTIEGKIYDVLVEILDDGAKPPPPLPTAALPLETAAMSFGAPPPSRPPSATPASVAPPSKGSHDVPSPLAGKIVSIDVKVGQTVQEGAQVATIEAMKMNTYIFAPKTGVVESIHANPGDGVDEGAILIRMA